MKKRGLLTASVLVIGMGMSVLTWAEEAPAQSGSRFGGLLSSLFSEDGVVENLLGEDGVVENLLGEDGVVENLLGEDGAVSSLLGDTELISSLFSEDGALAGILPEDVDINGVLQSVSSELEDVNSTLPQGIQSIAEMAADEDGSVDWEKVGGTAEELIDLLAGGLSLGTGSADTEESEEDLDAFIAELMIPYEKADAVMFDYVAERNAGVMDAGDVQIFSKKTGYLGDIEQDEVKVLADFTQVNFTIDGDQMNMVSAATDTLLLTLTRGEDGNFTVTDEKHAEDGENYEASLEALCEEVGIPVDDFYTGGVLGAYNDADALAKYLEEHPEIATAEFQGEQMTAEELRTLSNEYTDALFDQIFEMTEAATE